jgi:hypothetical protein
MRKLATVSRRRWPEFASPEPKIGVPPPKPKAAAVAGPPGASAAPNAPATPAGAESS